jgi:hypothetical protein
MMTVKIAVAPFSRCGLFFRSVRRMLVPIRLVIAALMVWLGVAAAKLVVVVVVVAAAAVVIAGGGAGIWRLLVTGFPSVRCVQGCIGELSRTQGVGVGSCLRGLWDQHVDPCFEDSFVEHRAHKAGSGLAVHLQAHNEGVSSNEGMVRSGR